MLRRKSCGVDVLDLGAAAVRHLLVYALGVGDQPGCSVACADFLAHAGDGRARRSEAMGAVWLAVGRGSVDQHRAAILSTYLRAVGLVPPRQARETFAGWTDSCVGDLSCMCYAL